MSAIWPSAVADALDLLTAVNNTKVTLNADIGVGDTTLTVDDASSLPASGYLTFDDNESNPETIYYTGVSGNDLTGLTRAADDTSAGSHVSGAHLEQRFNAAYHNTLTTEIIAIEQNLSDRFGTGTNIVVPTGVTFAMTDLTASCAVATDGSKRLVSSTTTATELGYVHGVTSAIQTQLGTKAAIAGQQFTGNISFDSATHGIVGISTNTAAAAGNVGQVVSSAAGFANLGTTNNWKSMASISLTAGNWIISLFATFYAAGATVTTEQLLISTVGDSSSGYVDGSTGGLDLIALSGSNQHSMSIPGYVVSLAGATTYYANALAIYTAATPQAAVRITAVRIS